MATVPEGYVELDLVGFTDKGTYSSSETYVKNDLVHNDNKIYLSLQDDNIGQALPSSTETENTYWKVWLAGSADDLANITVKDTSNVTGGGANKVVVAQNLIDAIANKVIQNMNSITQLNSKMITITTKDYEVTLTSSGGSSWGYSYGFSLVENGDLPTRTQLVIPIACGLKANWNTTGMVSVHQNDFVRVASNTGGIFDLRLAFISLRAPD